MAFDAELWLWDARRTQSWTFVSLPPGPAEALDVGDVATVTVELIDFTAMNPLSS